MDGSASARTTAEASGAAWIEHKPSDERRAIRVENSPISVAFEDMALRAEGLTGDTLGDAMDFFEMSDRDAHAALCSCLFGGTVEAGLAARRVGELLRPEQGRSGREWWGSSADLRMDHWR
jgi:hypothetical protein